MKIALVGASGLVGSAVLAELKERGHEVTTITRSASSVPQDGAVTSVEIDVLNNGSTLAETLKGHDAVISAFNAGWENPNYVEDFARASKLIQDAVKQAGITRLLVVIGAGSLYVDGVQLVGSPQFPEDFRDKAGAVRDYLNELKEETELDWVALSPAVNFGAGGTTENRGTYRTGKDEPVFDANGVSDISPADLARAIVDEIEHPAHHRERFTVGY